MQAILSLFFVYDCTMSSSSKLSHRLTGLPYSIIGSNVDIVMVVKGFPLYQ